MIYKKKLTFWVFLRSLILWPVRCTSCHGAPIPRNHRSGRCWGAGAPSASLPPPWSVVALPWSVCGPAMRHTDKVIWHECTCFHRCFEEGFSCMLTSQSKNKRVNYFINSWKNKQECRWIPNNSVQKFMRWLWTLYTWLCINIYCH